jgi:hypothetical protein
MEQLKLPIVAAVFVEFAHRGFVVTPSTHIGDWG